MVYNTHHRVAHAASAVTFVYRWDKSRAIRSVDIPHIPRFIFAPGCPAASTAQVLRAAMPGFSSPPWVAPAFTHAIYWIPAGFAWRTYQVQFSFHHGQPRHVSFGLHNAHSRFAGPPHILRGLRIYRGTTGRMYVTAPPHTWFIRYSALHSHRVHANILDSTASRRTHASCMVSFSRFTRFANTLPPPRTAGFTDGLQGSAGCVHWLRTDITQFARHYASLLPCGPHTYLPLYSPPVAAPHVFSFLRATHTHASWTRTFVAFSHYRRLRACIIICVFTYRRGYRTCTGSRALSWLHARRTFWITWLRLLRTVRTVRLVCGLCFARYAAYTAVRMHWHCRFGHGSRARLSADSFSFTWTNALSRTWIWFCVRAHTPAVLWIAPFWITLLSGLGAPFVLRTCTRFSHALRTPVQYFAYALYTR